MECRANASYVALLSPSLSPSHLPGLTCRSTKCGGPDTIGGAGVDELSMVWCQLIVEELEEDQ